MKSLPPNNWEGDYVCSVGYGSTTPYHFKTLKEAQEFYDKYTKFFHIKMYHVLRKNY